MDFITSLILGVMKLLPTYRGYDYLTDNWVIGQKVNISPIGFSINDIEVKDIFIGLGIVNWKGQDIFEGQYIFCGGRIFEIMYDLRIGPYLIDRTEGDNYKLLPTEENIIKIIVNGFIIGNTLMNTIDDLINSYCPRYTKKNKI